MPIGRGGRKSAFGSKRSIGSGHHHHGGGGVHFRSAGGGALWGASYAGPSGGETEDWKTGLFECDVMSCLDGWCCHYCMLGYISHELRFRGGIPPQCCNGGMILPLICDAYCTCGLLSMLGSCTVRSGVRQRYNLRDDLDWAKGCCCLPCSIAQISRELALRGEYAGGCFYQPPPNAPPRPQVMNGDQTMMLMMTSPMLMGGGGGGQPQMMVMAGSPMGMYPPPQHQQQQQMMMFTQPGQPMMMQPTTGMVVGGPPPPPQQQQHGGMMMFGGQQHQPQGLYGQPPPGQQQMMYAPPPGQQPLF